MITGDNQPLMGCFANRCVNEEGIAVVKLRSMVEAGRRLRG